jgi:hypothetical protein
MDVHCDLKNRALHHDHSSGPLAHIAIAVSRTTGTSITHLDGNRGDSAPPRRHRASWPSRMT